ncbi:hypothetical protein ABZX92_37440 [Lentzea sp. NPDC006480]|uniref:hypothetical protein n=1 Tax=Lentzea sp. NPDC006480 TaxID=3157176 RepID=UPI0033AB1993
MSRGFARVATTAAVAAGLVLGVGGTAFASQVVGVYPTQKSCNTEAARRMVQGIGSGHPVKLRCEYNASPLGGAGVWFMYQD